MKKALAIIIMFMTMVCIANADQYDEYVKNEYDFSVMTDEQLRGFVELGKALTRNAQAELDSRQDSIDANAYNEKSIIGKQFQFKKVSFQITGLYKHSERGNGYLLYEFTWTNTSDEPISFLFSGISLEAYQNGVECGYGMQFDVNTNSTTKIQPGYSLVSYDCVQLQDTSNIETHLSELYSFVDEPIVFTIDLKNIGKK